jgi:hypothetical protein
MHADSEVLPAHPEMSIAHLRLQAIQSARGRAANNLSIRIEGAAVTGTTKLRTVRRPSDRAAQMRADGRENFDVAWRGSANENPDGSGLPGFVPTILTDDFNGKEGPASDGDCIQCTGVGEIIPHGICPATSPQRTGYKCHNRRKNKAGHEKHERDRANRKKSPAIINWLRHKSYPETAGGLKRGRSLVKFPLFLRAADPPLTRSKVSARSFFPEIGHISCSYIGDLADHVDACAQAIILRS